MAEHDDELIAGARLAQSIHSGPGWTSPHADLLGRLADALEGAERERNEAVATVHNAVEPMMLSSNQNIIDNFLGIVGTECGEHRTVGDYRAWCHACTMWCYPGDPCFGCAEPVTSARIEALTAERDSVRSDNEALKAENEALREMHVPLPADFDAPRRRPDRLLNIVTEPPDAK